MKQLLITLSFSMLLPVIYAQEHIISGHVTDEAGHPLSFVNVYLEGTVNGTSTNDSGFFSFVAGQEKGILKVSRMDYETYTLEGHLCEMGNLKIVLRQKITQLPEVTVVTGNYLLKSSSTIQSEEAVDLVTTAGSQGDLYKSIALLPGTQVAATDGRLLVRGGTSRESQTFIDDMHVLSPYTANSDNVVSRGRFSPFIFEGINFSMGGYSPEYSQSLSSILPLYTKDEHPYSKIGVSLMNVSVGGGGTKVWDRSSSSLDVTYTDMTFYNATFHPKEKELWDKPFRDFSVKNQTRLVTGDNSTLKTFGSYSKTGFRHKTDAMPASDNYFLRYNEDNLYTNLTFRKKIKNHTNFFAGAAYSWNNKKTENGMTAGDKAAIDEKELHLKSKMNRRFSNWYKLEAGIESYIRDSRFSYRDGKELSKQINNNISGMYISNDFNLTGTWFLQVAGRAEYASSDHSIALLPRLALSYQHQGLTVSAVSGLYQQAVENQYLIMNDKQKMETNFQTMLGIYYQRNSRIYRAEIYEKRYNHLPLFSGGEITSDGFGYSRGIDLFFNDRGVLKNFEYVLAYSFNDSKRKYLDYPVMDVPDYITRHNASLTLKYSNFDLRTIAGITARFASGRHYRDPNQGGFMNCATPAYFALDVSWTILAGKKTIIYLSASNILNRKNIYGYKFSSEPDKEGKYHGSPITLYHNQAIYVGAFITLGKNAAYETSYF